MYLEFCPEYSHVIPDLIETQARLQYVPKVPTTPFRDQLVNLQVLPCDKADSALLLLCPVIPACLLGPHRELQVLRAALCLLWMMEGEGCL